jgi:hypothetical protein
MIIHCNLNDNNYSSNYELVIILMYKELFYFVFNKNLSH